MSKKKLHKFVHNIYKIVLGLLLILSIQLDMTKIVLCTLTILWLFEDEIEELIEAAILKVKGGNTDE